MGEMIQFKGPDGKACPGYLAPPKSRIKRSRLCRHPGMVGAQRSD